MNRNEQTAYAIIDDIYHAAPELARLLWLHSRAVADLALECIDRHRLHIDRNFVEQAALLHDIGIIATDAPPIFCHGSEPYIRHGIIGADMLRRRGLPRHALVAERHTGAGLSAADIHNRHLPLPERDFLPLSVEERLICYADKFYSKSGDPKRRKSLEQVRTSMQRHGTDTLARFNALEAEFGAG